MLVIGPDIPPALLPFAQAVVDALGELKEPAAPFKLPSLPTPADLPPAAEWGLHGIVVESLNCLVHSTLIAGVWTWRRSDGSAL
jgi:hypothetical protein